MFNLKTLTKGAVISAVALSVMATIALPHSEAQTVQGPAPAP